MDAKAHWETVYRTKSSRDVSWYQAEPHVSLALIERARPDRAASILDVGGGASTLVDSLVTAGYRQVTVLDVSASALASARARVGEAARHLDWLEADVLSGAVPAAAFDVWHDRAMFHFLTSGADRIRYVEQVRRALKPGGFVLVGTFAEDGPTRCSGLPVVRYQPSALHAEFGPGFSLVESVRETHVTPSGASQAFVYCLCRLDTSSGIAAA